MIPRLARGRRRLSAPRRSALIALAALVGGCASSGEEELSDLPTLQEIAPANPVKAPEEARTPRRAVGVRRVRVPADTDWSAIAELIDGSGVSDAGAARWRAHGLRVAVLAKGEARELADRLPRRARASTETLLVGDAPYPVTTYRRLRRPVRVRLPGAEEPRIARRGRFQFLVTAGAGAMRIEPHWHKREPSLRPQPPDERRRAGRRFRGLAITVTAGADELVAIAAGPFREPAATRPARTRPERSGRSLGQLLLRDPGGGRAGMVLLINPP